MAYGTTITREKPETLREVAIAVAMFPAIEGIPAGCPDLNVGHRTLYKRRWVCPLLQARWSFSHADLDNKFQVESLRLSDS